MRDALKKAKKEDLSITLKSNKISSATIQIFLEDMIEETFKFDVHINKVYTKVSQ